ncbi:MAG: phosphodiester glycosidase family protein [Phycisphaerae bacterium]|jgi:hypothetical protein
MKKVVTFLMVVILLSLFAVWADTASAARVISDWSYIYDGVWYATGSDTSPRLMRAYAIRIDLDNPDISLRATNTNGDATGETDLKTPSQFLTGQSLEAAINANFFVNLDGVHANVNGLLMRAGSVISSHSSSYPIQLRVTSDNEASIVDASGNPSGVYTAVAGDAWHLTNGGCYGANDTADPRTSVGISQDGRFLIMCVVDGRQPGYSMGATILDMSYWMKDFGAHNAMNLDGGGSTCMVRKNGGDAQILNSPSENREVGANLGVNALDRETRHDIFVRGGQQGNINCKHKIGNDDWSNWQYLGKPDVGTVGDPAAISRSPEKISLYVTGGDGQIYRKFYNGSWSDTWVAFDGNSIVGGPSACAMNSDRIDLFARDTNNHLLHKKWTVDDGWGDWVNRGGSIASDPAATSWGPGRIDVFARSTDGTLVQIAYDNGSWGSWYDHGHSMIGSPAVCARDKNILDVFWREADGRLKHKAWLGLGWTDITNLGGAGLNCGDPGATSRDTGVVTVFIPQSDGYIWSRNWNSNGWYAWSNAAGDSMNTQHGVDACSWTNDAGTHQ